jgi:hypothetical protein
MRTFIFTVLICLVLVASGCSKGSLSPVNPLPANVSNYSQDGYQVLNSGTLDLDNQTVEFPDRMASPYLNVTGIVGSNFSFTIDGINPPDILRITLRINNISGLTVHDVCIVFENLYGKQVTNPDSYMDIFQPLDKDPFIAFRKEDPNRAFPPGIDTEQLLLKFPSGSDPRVDFFIIAHLGGNAGGVYEIRDWNVTGSLTETGGNATIKVKALDHQADVTTVTADTTLLTGGITTMTKAPEPDTWQAAITNSAHAPAGTYTIEIMGTSPASPTYQTYNYFPINVSSTSAKIDSVNFVALPTQDTTFDICAAPNGYIYVAADHPATGNTGSKRTMLRFNNNLTGMTVLNSGTGMNHNYALPFTRIEASNTGYIFNNPDTVKQSCWQDTGDSTPDVIVEGRLLSYCTTLALGDFYTVDFSGDNYCIGVVTFSDCLQAQKSIAWPESAPTSNYGGGMFIPPNYTYDAIAGIDGIDGTLDTVFLISKGSEQYLSLSGDWLTSHAEVLEIMQTGTSGTGDGQFTGGKDVAVNSSGYIITLESHGGGVFRFQKFDSYLTWYYTSLWSDNGDPKRMDFDKADNRLYVLTSTGVHEMTVQ